MSEKKNLLVAQSGGPTAAINATLAGVITAAEKCEDIDNVMGACYGIQGVLEEKIINLTKKIDTPEKAGMLSRTPAAALGSCRFKLDDTDRNEKQYRQIIDIFKKYNIGYFVYIGGNDSMDTVYKLSEYCKKHDIDDIKVIGAPKTIDNDLCGIDHCPGFGSAAKYIATVFAELERESQVYETRNVIIVEMMGRNAGWLTAAAALAECKNGSVPYLIYLEENVIDMDKFIDDVREMLIDNTAVMVAVSEGIHDSEGRFICEQGNADKELDVFGHNKLAGTGKILEEAVKEKIGCKVRSIELNLLQRCASHIMSKTDIEESKKLGENAVSLAVNGRSGEMSTLTRADGMEYKVSYSGVDISEVANQEKKVPKEWINSDGNGVTKEMLDYLKPLIQGEIANLYVDGIPKYMILK